MTLKVFLFEGGEVVKTIKAEEFARAIGVAVREGGMMELLPEQADKVLKDPPPPAPRPVAVPVPVPYPPMRIFVNGVEQVVGVQP